MSVSSPHLWKLLVESQLIDTPQAQRLQEQFSSEHPSGAAEGTDQTLIRWLVAQGTITRYQGALLQAGHTGPLHYGDYRVTDRVESGRLAGLFRAVHLPTGQETLLAFSPDQAIAHSGWDTARLERARRMVHPHWQRLYEVVEGGSVRFAVLEAVEGDTVRRVATRQKRLSIPEACLWGRQMALALVPLHEAEEAYGWLRPENVLVDSQGHVKLLCAPIASDLLLAAPSTSPGTTAGRPRREATQRLDRQDPAADIRALGFLLWELFAGQPPPNPNTAGADPHAALTNLPPPLVDLVASVIVIVPGRPKITARMMAEVLSQFIVPATVPPQEAPHAERLAAFEAALQARVNPLAVIGAERPLARKRRVERKNWWSRGAMIAGLASAALVVAFLLAPGRKEQTTHPDPTQPNSSALDPQNSDPTSSAKLTGGTHEQPATKDGTFLWVSPTSGPPLEWSGLPPGVQVLFAFRPGAIANHPEGEKVLAALGPEVEAYVQKLEGLTGIKLADMDQLLVGLAATPTDTLDVALAVRLRESQSQREWNALGRGLRRETYEDAEYWVSADNQWAYHFPDDSGVQLLIASPDRLRELLEVGEPPLSPQLERLAASTDQHRHFTMLFSPHFLWGDGRAVLAGMPDRARRGLFAFLGDDAIQAAALSMHLGEESFFVEMQLRAGLDLPPHKLVTRLRQRVQALPEAVESYLAGATPSSYGAEILEKYPRMIRFLERYARFGVERENAVIRAYQPVLAAHNLLLGTELVLAEMDGAPTTASSENERGTALQKRSTLSFRRETLETALQLLAADLGVEIQILGDDLKAEGITRNQSFGLSLQNEPGGKILLEILLAANPDRTASGPADSRQKLVYVVRPPGADGKEVFQVTTRAAAAARGDPLPAPFVQEK